MTKHTNESPEAIEVAMNTVLQAERDAEQAIADCRQAAAQIVQEAQTRAQRIARRTNERLAICHMRCNAKISREIKTRQRADRTTAHTAAIESLDEAALADIVSAVARELIGNAQSSSEAKT